MEIRKEQDGEVVCTAFPRRKIIGVHLEERFRATSKNTKLDIQNKERAENANFCCIVLFCGRNYDALKI